MHCMCTVVRYICDTADFFPFLVKLSLITCSQPGKHVGFLVASIVHRDARWYPQRIQIRASGQASGYRCVRASLILIFELVLVV